MRRFRIFTFLLIAAGGLCSAVAQEPAATSPVDPSLEKLTTEFVEAFNRHAVPEVVAQFSEDAQVTDNDGGSLNGRAEIEARFKALFESYPEAKIAVSVQTLRQVTPDVAVEDGVTVTTLTANEPPTRSAYSLVYLRKGDKWQIANLRDFEEESVGSAHQQLLTLGWLVGEWVDESPDGRVETTCKWSEDGNFLLQEYVIRTKNEITLKGTQRIGWDPVRKSFRSWAFDHSGAFTEGAWTETQASWMIQVEGVTADGRRATATRKLTRVTQDSFQLETSNIVVGNELHPSTAVRIVRRPPAPGNSGT